MRARLARFKAPKKVLFGPLATYVDRKDSEVRSPQLPHPRRCGRGSRAHPRPVERKIPAGRPSFDTRQAQSGYRRSEAVVG